ncbi:MAG: cytosine permease [Fusicatenibacter sp.]|nr:cytosine permease [Lachnospiraceae bacterium]MDY2937901.1 cytosine permease [Fusicatenibacter sp.]
MEKETKDVDFADRAVPVSARKNMTTMFMIMLGFTFFSASMWVGQELADGLDFWGFLGALILGGIILGIYTGLLGYVGAKTGLSLDLLSQRAFGVKGSYLPSAMISFTQIGWFGVGLAMFAIPVSKELLGGSAAAQWILVIAAGVCMTASAYFGIQSLTIVSYIAVPLVAILGTVAMVLAVMRGDGSIIDQFAVSSGSLTVIGGAGLVVGSFVSGGTATPNFARFAKNGKAGMITTVIAFFIGNSLMFFFGAVSSIFVGGNDIFEVMIRLNLFYLAVLVLGLNIWTTNDNALYSAGLGLANIFHQKKKPMVLASGIIGTIASVWLYYNFCNWLNILNCTLPPVGIILVLSYFMNRKDYEQEQMSPKTVDWFAVAGVVLGAVVANVVKWGIASINGMVIAAVCYYIGQVLKQKKA